MNYIDILTTPEITALCGIISGRDFKELFKKNEREFSKIRKGFRAKSLSDERALSIGIANIDKPFIAMWINTRVDIWLKEIEEHMAMLENEGLTHDIAMATTILDSLFVNNVALYLKLAGIDMDEEALHILHEGMESVKTERMRAAEVSERILALEDEREMLVKQVEVAQKSIGIIREEYEQKIQQITVEKNSLESMLAGAQGKIAELQAASTVDEDSAQEHLAQFDDTDISNLPSADSDEIVSLCGVISDFNGQKWLIRYADLSCDGYYQIFKKRDDLPPFFSNRDRIFYKDGPSDDGFCGNWNWSAIPNANDSSRDYIVSKYNTKVDAIEVVTVSDVSNLDALINILRRGIEYQIHSRKVMIAFYVSKGKYIGVLCSEKDLNAANGILKFTEDCNDVPVYNFSAEDCIRIGNDITFYRKAFAGIPIQLYQVKSTLDIVKNIVLSSVSWATYKTRNVTRSEYKAFRDFLSAIPVENITKKIEIACHCSNSVAKALLDEFMAAVWNYVNGNSIEDEIILSAIAASSELQERTKALIRADWEAENAVLLVEAKKTLDALDSKAKSAAEYLNEAEESLKDTKLKEERLTAIIAEKEKLAKDVEEAVAERINKARTNAADFIASMAFIGAQPTQISSVETVGADASIDSSVDPYHIVPTIEELDDLEANHSWADVINTASLELIDAGVSDKYSNGLAAFLCSAYIERQPIILVGPNALAIVQAFAAAVAGHNHGVLSCDGSYSNKITERIGASGETIVVINNLLTSGWMNRLPEIISRTDIFYIATHPYAEDIQVEPKSLYGFMLPLFTDFFVDKKATGKYYGGFFAEDFKGYSSSKNAQKEVKILSQLSVSSLIRNRINEIITTMNNIYSATTLDDEFLFGILPIAYASLSMNKLTEAISDPQKGIELSANLKRDLRYVLGEI